MSTTLAPSSPRAVVCRAGERVLDAHGIFASSLRRHGAAATQRRYTRAIAGCSVPAAALVVLGVLLSTWWPVGPAAVLLLVGLLLGRSRAAALGHLVTPRFLVTRTGSLARRTAVVELDGAVAVGIRRSFFQRRAGVATVQLATAAGGQRYDVLDVPADAAAGVAEQILPGYVQQFARSPADR